VNKSRIKSLQKKYPRIPLQVLVKTDLLFHGVRYTQELSEAGAWAIPNYQPYRFQEGEEDPTGKGYINIPYLLTIEGGSLVRILGNGESPYRIIGDGSAHALMEGDEHVIRVEFQKKPLWQQKTTADGTPMSSIGISQHGDMLILNPTPGCEYFLHRNEKTGENYRCKFCHYGVPDKRTKQLGQEIGTGEIGAEHIERIMNVCEAAQSEIKHFYLVGGSMVDIEEEGKRYVQLAEAVQKVNKSNIPVCCGSSALKHDAMLQLKDAGVTGVCLNLEIWDEKLWEIVSPGKSRFVGRDQWIQGLLDAVEIFGRGNVMSAFVSGIELTVENGFKKTDDALASCTEGTKWLLEHGILSLYSIQWPFAAQPGKDFTLDTIQNYFINLNIAQFELRKKQDLPFPNDFVCHQCTYMQLECDFDYYYKS
jgi:hypothetical protein